MDTNQSAEQLVKVWVDLPNHPEAGGESFWALPLGGDFYELRNVPFHAYGLNFADVVRAIPQQPDQKPQVLAVERPSGHRTFRVYFSGSVQPDQRGPLLRTLNAFEAYFENADGTLYAIDLEQPDKYNAVYDQLDLWERDGLLVFETCEARVPDGFGCPPPDSE